MNHHNEALFSTKILFTTKYTVNALPIFVDNYLTSYTYTIFFLFIDCACAFVRLCFLRDYRIYGT